MVFNPLQATAIHVVIYWVSHIQMAAHDITLKKVGTASKFSSYIRSQELVGYYYTVSFHVKAVEGLRGHLRAPGREASQLGSKLQLPGPQQTLLQLS